MKKFIILSALTLALVGCSQPIEATDGKGAEYEELGRIQINEGTSHMTRTLWIHKETNCVYMKGDELMPVAEQEYSSITNKCTGYYQNKYK